MDALTRWIVRIVVLAIVLAGLGFCVFVGMWMWPRIVPKRMSIEGLVTDRAEIADYRVDGRRIL